MISKQSMRTALGRILPCAPVPQQGRGHIFKLSSYLSENASMAGKLSLTSTPERLGFISAAGKHGSEPLCSAVLLQKEQSVAGHCQELTASSSD